MQLEIYIRMIVYSLFVFGINLIYMYICIKPIKYINNYYYNYKIPLNLNYYIIITSLVPTSVIVNYCIYRDYENILMYVEKYVQLLT
jgi:hypothetical protein